ncbi:fungal-specific transcription factor domain-containing protein [Trichoderma velutinum]
MPLSNYFGASSSQNLQLRLYIVCRIWTRTCIRTKESPLSSLLLSEAEKMADQTSKSNSQKPSESQGPVVSSWSCFNCRRRKSRCNRQSPCGFCSKAGVECLYPFSGRMPTRQHNSATASVPSSRAPRPRKRSEVQLQELLSRLRQLENVVDGMKAQARDEDSTPRHTNSSNVDTRSSKLDSTTEEGLAPHDIHAMEAYHDNTHKVSRSFGSLHVCEEGTLYTSNGFWAALHGELRSVREAFETSDMIDLTAFEDDVSPDEAEHGQIPFTFSQSNPLESTFHPAPHLLSFIWQMYVENVDPFIKVLHVPTITEVIRLSEGGFDKLSLGMRALIFSISLAAVTSLSNSDVQEAFQDAKDVILSRLVLGTEKALSQAGILTTTDLCVAQASLIYLESAGHRYGMRTVWMMSGILVRAATSVGLHRDGATFPNVSFFEAEMRRRLWWHICCFDARVSQCYAPETMISNSILDTREPTNCNDTDLGVNMTKEPIAREGFTDVSFTLMACELRRLCSHVLSSMSALLASGEKQQAAQCIALRKIEEAREWATTKFFGISGPARAVQPFAEFLFGMLLDQLSIIVRDTNIFGKSASFEQTDARDRSYLSAVALIENMRKWRDQSSTRQWGWVMINFQPWYAVGIVLIHLQTQAWDSGCERAWTLVVKTLNEIPSAMMTQNPLRESIVGMVTATRQHRKEQLAQQNSPSRTYDNNSPMPQICASISIPTDFWPSSSGVDLATDLSVDTYPTEGEMAEPLNISLDTKPVELSQDHLSEGCFHQEQIHSEVNYPPWYIESSDDLDTMEPNYGSLQQLFFHSILENNGGHMPV